ncbi:MAG: glycosyltransferase family A protein [Vampirovibrionales bacterium]|nr:glycosyltransferase family A protein [Vampirovibrionales bacterium]
MTTAQDTLQTLIPKVSIVMPAYNAEELIGPALDAILAQTFTDWELIVANDASTDGTLAILEEYAARDARIKFKTIQRDKKATCHAAVRLAAIEDVTGEYLAFMDSDDLYEPQALERMAGYLDAHPQAQSVYGLHREVDHDGRFITQTAERHWNDLTPEHFTLDFDTLHSWENIILQRIPMMLATMMVRKSFFDKVGGLDPRIIWDDYFFFLRMFCEDRSAVHRINQYVFRYRFNKNGVSKSTEMFKRILKDVPLLVDYLSDKLNVSQYNPQYTASFLAAKMYADICWLRYRAGLNDQVVYAAFIAFMDTRVRFKDWLRSCGGLMGKALIPAPLWKLLKALSGKGRSSSEKTNNETMTNVTPIAAKPVAAS